MSNALDSRTSIPKTAMALLLVVPFFYPFVFLVTTSVKTPEEYTFNPLGWPQTWTWANLEYAWNGAGMGQALVNSTIAVTVGVVVSAYVSTAGAFWFIRHRSKRAELARGLILAMWVIPPVAFIIPFFVILNGWHLTNNLYVLGIAYAALNCPFGVLLMYAYFTNGLPEEILESSALDGAGAWQQLQHIVFPLSRPALTTVMALTFIWSWGDLLVSLVLMQDQNKLTLMPAIATLNDRFSASIQPQAAAALIAVIPLIPIFLLAQRAIVRGFTAGIGK